MNSKIIPYEGNEPYIFFSYCRQNAQEVYEIIGKMAEAGFRIWYDDGVHPGDDWPETIADHINRCIACIAAVSEEFSMSHNCKNEMNYVIGRGMLFVPIVMKRFSMTPGMSFMLSGSQYIRKYEFPDESAFYQRLMAAEGLQVCRGVQSVVPPVDGTDSEREADEAREREKRERQEREAREREKRERQEREAREREERERQMREAQERERQERETREREEREWQVREAQEREERERQIREAREREERERQMREAQEDEDNTIYEYDDEDTRFEDDEQTVFEDEESTTLLGGAPEKRQAVLVYLSEAKYYELLKPNTKLGRSASCDIQLRSTAVSSFHAVIGHTGQGYFLRDEDSRNGTWLGTKKIAGMQPVILGKKEMVTCADEKLFFASGDYAKEILRDERYAMLSCQETEEFRLVDEQELLLGRSYVWEGGTFSDQKASHYHGKIIFDNGRYYFVAKDEETTNGTYLNNRLLKHGESVKLHNNDVIRIGQRIYHLRFQIVALTKGERI